MTTKKELLHSANNMEKLIVMNIRKNSELMEDEQIKQHILNNLKAFTEVKQTMSNNDKKFDLDTKFKELVKIQSGLNFIIKETETFKQMIK